MKGRKRSRKGSDSKKLDDFEPLTKKRKVVEREAFVFSKKDLIFRQFKGHNFIFTHLNESLISTLHKNYKSSRLKNDNPDYFYDRSNKSKKLFIKVDIFLEVLYATVSISQETKRDISSSFFLNLTQIPSRFKPLKEEENRIISDIVLRQSEKIFNPNSRSAYNTIQKVSSEFHKSLELKNISPEVYYDRFLNHNNKGKEIKRNVIKSEVKEANVNQCLVTIDDHNMSIDECFQFYNGCGINKSVPSRVRISKRNSELNEICQKEFKYYKTTNGYFASLTSLIGYLIKSQFHFGLMKNNNLLVKLGMDDGSDVPDHCGKVAFSLTVLNSIMYGSQKNTFLFGIMKEKETYQNYRKNVKKLKEEIENLKKNGFSLQYKDKDELKTINFNIGFVLTTDLKTLFALSEILSLIEEFCAYCSIKLKGRFHFDFGDSRKNINDLFGIEFFIYCILHCIERITEFVCVLVTLQIWSLAESFQILIRKIQKSVTFISSKPKNKMNDENTIKVTMIYGKNCFLILKMLQNNVESVYNEYNEEVKRKNKEGKAKLKKLLKEWKEDKIGSKPKYHGLKIISKNQTNDIKKFVECSFEALVLINAPSDVINETHVKKLEKHVKKMFDIRSKIDTCRSSCPIYMHYLAETPNLIRRLGYVGLSVFKNEGLERLNKDRVKVIGSKLKFGGKCDDILVQQLNHEFRRIYIFQNRIELLKNSGLNVQNIVDDMEFYNNEYLKNLIDFNWKEEIRLDESRKSLYLKIINLLRNRNVWEKNEDNVSQWRDNPLKFPSFEMKVTELAEIINSFFLVRKYSV